jgi:hypothetical protein
MSYKKVKTVLVYGKKKCIYMKPKGTREYVKSKGEYVLLPVYVKRVAKIAAKKLIKNKNGKKKLRGGEYKTLSLHVRDVNDYTVLDLCEITDSKTELVLLSEEKIERLRVNGKLCIAVKIKDKDVNDVLSARNVTKYYYKKNEKSKLEEIDTTEVTIDYKQEYSAGISKKIYYYIYKEFRSNETIYSEKDRCKLQSNNDNGSIKFNKEGVKKILFDYKPPFEKLYIYDSTGYKEIDVPNYLQRRNLPYLARDNVDSVNPFTHTRMVFPTPSHYSNRVAKDIVDNPKKSNKSIISQFVDKVKTMRIGSTTPTHATNDPFNKHYEINSAYVKSRGKNSTFSKIINAFRKKTDDKIKEEKIQKYLERKFNDT